MDPVSLSVGPQTLYEEDFCIHKSFRVKLTKACQAEPNHFRFPLPQIHMMCPADMQTVSILLYFWRNTFLNESGTDELCN